MTFFTLTLAVSLITAAVASLSFAILFHITPRHLPLVALEGGVTYFIFYTVLYFNGSDFTAALLSTLFTALFAGFAARIRRAPTIVFLIPGIIPTVPGASLYNTMHHAIVGEWDAAIAHLLVALEIALGIAGGILLVSAVFGLVADFLSKRRTISQQTPQNSYDTEKSQIDPINHPKNENNS